MPGFAIFRPSSSWLQPESAIAAAKSNKGYAGSKMVPANPKRKAEETAEQAAQASKRSVSLIPGFDARRIYLRDGQQQEQQNRGDGNGALDFSKCAAGARPGLAELQAVTEAVASGGIVSLNLANNDLSEETALALARALGAASCALAALNVRGNWSTMEDDEVEPRVGVALAEALRPPDGRSSSSLTELDAGGNNLWGPEAATALAAAVRTPGTSSLVALDLQGCAIGDAGAAAITSTLRAGSSLTSLGVGWNQLSSASSTALAEALQSPACRLRRLGHWRNNLGEAGGVAIASSLASPNCCLTELDIGWNNIGPVGGAAIAEALTSPHCKLTKLVAVRKPLMFMCVCRPFVKNDPQLIAKTGSGQTKRKTKHFTTRFLRETTRLGRTPACSLQRRWLAPLPPA